MRVALCQLNSVVGDLNGNASRILDWYGDFNRTRDAFFSSRGIFDGLVPASTGMAGSNPQGTALNTGASSKQASIGTAIAEMVACGVTLE